jgi:hypothetical protein
MIEGVVGEVVIDKIGIVAEVLAHRTKEQKEAVGGLHLKGESLCQIFLLK